MKITAKMILELLLKKHSDDICIPECSAGGRIDLWVMERWGGREYIGYEIKVDRQDFLNDNKWQNYLPYCSCFYFVAPKGVIEKNELPPEAGLLEVSKNCKMLYTRKKTAIKKKEPPTRIFRYILLNRAKIVRGYDIHKVSNLEYWRDWVKEKEEKRLTGHTASEIIREMVAKQVGEIEDENRTLKNENKKLAKVKQFCEILGLNTDKYYWSANNLREELELILGQQFNGVPTRLSKKIDKALATLGEAQKLIKKYEQNGQDRITSLYKEEDLEKLEQEAL